MSRLCALLVCGCLAVPALGGVAAQQPLAVEGTGSVAGRVLRPDGLPQPEAEVVAAIRTREGQLRLLPWRSRTAFDGRYEITGVAPGRYLILVRVVGADGPVEGRPLATLFPGVATTEPGTPVEIFAGVPAEGIDVWLLPAPRRFQVAGRVVDPKGRELENLAIEFGRPLSRAESVWTITEPGGLFTLDGVTPGPVVLRARADSPDGPLIGVVSTELAVESAQDVRIVVREPARVTGQLIVQPGAGLPDRVRVALMPILLRPSALYPADEASADAGGRFDLRGGPGEHELSVRGLPAGWVVRRVMTDRTPVVGGRFWLAAGRTINDVRVEIGPAAARPRASR
jgi:hypothetical protein